MQRSAILRALNETFPPSGGLLNALNRIDPGVAIRGPDPGVGPPDPAVAGDAEVRSAAESVVRVLGTACGLGVSGSGWIARPGLVVTNAHVIAGEDDTTVSLADGGARLEATPVHYDPANDLALLRVDGLEGAPLRFAEAPTRGTPGAVIGYPENGPLAFAAARLGVTGSVTSEDSYGRGLQRRELTALRGEIRSGNSGGPVVDGDGRVLATIFASTVSKVPGGYGVPNEIVEAALADSSGEVDTGPCTG
ncbi:MAG: trypsin-like peptidase domain-containing protein [Actinomycetota bacterium]|nr:trypsin-like peptidase domain-containing protein [Actinomycetota bacterium]